MSFEGFKKNIKKGVVGTTLIFASFTPMKGAGQDSTEKTKEPEKNKKEIWKDIEINLPVDSFIELAKKRQNNSEQDEYYIKLQEDLKAKLAEYEADREWLEKISSLKNIS